MDGNTHLTPHEFCGKSKVENDPWTPLEISESTDNASGSTPNVTDSVRSSSLRLSIGMPQNPLYQMIDSEKYIQSLEQKLSKLTKNRRKEPTSRDIINSLAVFHEDQMRRYIDDTIGFSPSANDGFSDDGSAHSSFLQRRLYPERQPLNPEEIAELLKEDVVAERFEQLSTEAESKDANQLSHNTVTDISSAEANTVHLPKVSSNQTPAECVSSKNSSEIVHSGDNDSALNESDNNWANFDRFNEEHTEKDS
ncbi:RNA 3'-terminal phosphate cyclase-like [Plakobranchus ocellatus]|uniref:RNA 3'-terminal phosphate cyclase-like n=1 Tax=Plakobranchus ocellatus TaxID=259542 RepID=A0AAV4B5A2_9GAST|nr:RNA 3'-terminal phosphate cyclase-like [Plakobranchus ocellatus]